MTKRINVDLRGWIRASVRTVYVVPILAFLALATWAVASPIGASPDDDYHLASIWCAQESRTDMCAPDPAHAHHRLVPPGIAMAPCFVSDPAQSAACQEWPEVTGPTQSVSHGNWINAYPPLYYAAFNPLASHEVQDAALAMRLVSVFLFVALTTAIAILVPRDLRVPLLAGWAITIVPLAGHLIASNNPGSWAVIGVGNAWVAAYGWFRTHGKRAWALGALTVVSVLMAAGARTDAAVYSILCLGIASVLAFARTKAYALKLILPGALVLIAAAFFLASGNSDVATGGLNGGVDAGTLGGDVRNQASVLAFNLISIPMLWSGVFGSWGLGWLMETWPGFSMVEFGAGVVFIAFVSLGLRIMPWRKATMVVALIATLYLLPVYVLTVGMSVVSENVQPRYLVPLVVVLGGVFLVGSDTRHVRPTRWHVIPAIILLTVANSVAHYGTLRRYVTGFDVEQLSLDAGAEWWWDGAPIGPTAVWLIGTVVFGLCVGVLGRAWLSLDAVAQEGPHENKRPSEGDAANEPDRVWAKDGA